MMYKLKGKVKSGLGEGSFWTKKISKIFKEKYNMELFPGTLNIELEKEYILKGEEKIIPTEYGGDYNVLIQKGKLFDSIVYIVRAEINNAKGGTHPLNIVELVSDKNLRDKYKLNDNDAIEIIIQN